MSDTTFSPHDLPVTTLTLTLSLTEDKANKDVDVLDTITESAIFQFVGHGTVSGVTFLPRDPLVADDINYATLTVYLRDPASANPIEIASLTTKTAGSGGSGDWTAGVEVPLEVVNVHIANGYIVTFEITKEGTGVVVPVGELKVAYNVASRIALPAPTGLSVVQVASDLDLNWVNNSGGRETGIVVEQDRAPLITLPPHTTNHAVSGLPPWTDIAFRVKAERGIEQSNYSNEEIGSIEGYSYGWPSGGSYEPNVKAQWLFDNPGPGAIDVVNSVTTNVVGSTPFPVHNIVAGGDWTALSPGAQVMPAGADGGGGWQTEFGYDYLRIPSSTNFVIEIVFRLDYAIQVNATRTLFSTALATGDRSGVAIGASRSSTLQEFWLRAYSASGSSGTWRFNLTGTGDEWNNHIGVFRKYRVSCVRASTTGLRLHIDGTLRGSLDFTSRLTNNYAGRRCAIGGTNSAGSRCHGTLLELRLTVGNATNNSGGPGGG